MIGSTTERTSPGEASQSNDAHVRRPGEIDDKTGCGDRSIRPTGYPQIVDRATGRRQFVSEGIDIKRSIELAPGVTGCESSNEMIEISGPRATDDRGVLRVKQVRPADGEADHEDGLRTTRTA